MQHLKDLSIAKKIELYTLLYEDLSGMGIDGDTELAHVNKEEMSVLRSMGGSGTVNPRTQLVQFMGGSSPPPAQASQTIRQEATIPDELAPFVTDILEKSKATQEERARKGFETIDGDRIARFTPEQERAFEGISGLTGKGQEYFDKSEALTDRATAVPTSEEVGGLMSPYIQNVVNIQNREAQRAADIQQQKIDSAAVSAGGFGGSRHGIVEAEHFRNLATQKGDIQERGLAAAFEDAQTRLAQQRAREFQGASQIGNLGVTAPGQATNEFRNLEAVGTQQQSQTQKNLNVAQQDFEIGRTFPERTLQDYNAIVRGFSAPIQASTNTNTQAFTPAPSFLSQAAGTGLAVAGIANAFKGGFKEGGLIGLYGGGQPQINSYKEGTGSYTIGAQPNKEPTARTGLLNFIRDNVFARSDEDTYTRKVERIEEQRKLKAEERQALDTARNNAIQQQPVPPQPQQQQAALSQPVPPQNVSKFADGTGRHTIGGRAVGADAMSIDEIIASLEQRIQDIASRGGNPGDLAPLQAQLNRAMERKREQVEGEDSRGLRQRVREDAFPGDSIINPPKVPKTAMQLLLESQEGVGPAEGSEGGPDQDALEAIQYSIQQRKALQEDRQVEPGQEVDPVGPDDRGLIKRIQEDVFNKEPKQVPNIPVQQQEPGQEVDPVGPDDRGLIKRMNQGPFYPSMVNPPNVPTAAELLRKQKLYNNNNNASLEPDTLNPMTYSELRKASGLRYKNADDVLDAANKIRELNATKNTGVVPDYTGGSASSVNPTIPPFPDDSIGVGQDDQAQPLAADKIRDDAIANAIANTTTIDDGVSNPVTQQEGLAYAYAGKDPDKLVAAIGKTSGTAPPSSTNTLFGDELYDKWLAETAKQKEGLTEQKAELGREKWMQVAKLGFSILSQPGGQTFLQSIGSGAVKSGFVDGLSKLTAEQRKLTNKIGSLNKQDLKLAFGLSDKKASRILVKRNHDEKMATIGQRTAVENRKFGLDRAKFQRDQWTGGDGLKDFNAIWANKVSEKNMKKYKGVATDNTIMWDTNFMLKPAVSSVYKTVLYNGLQNLLTDGNAEKVAMEAAVKKARELMRNDQG